MSLVSFIGPKAESARHQQHQSAAAAGSAAADPGFRRDGEGSARSSRYSKVPSSSSFELDITYPARLGIAPASRRGWLRCVPQSGRCDQDQGNNILVVTDRRTPAANGWPFLPCSPLSAVHQHLVTREGLRTSTLVWWWKPVRRAKSITSPCWPATAPKPIHPYLAMETLASMHFAELAPDAHQRRQGDPQLHQGDRQGSVQKVMSKMGISTYMSYTGAQIFEAVGLDKPRTGGYLFHRHYLQPGRRHRSCSKWPKRCAAPCTAAAYGDDPVLADALDAGGEYAWAHARRRAHVDARFAIAKLQHSYACQQARRPTSRICAS